MKQYEVKTIDGQYHIVEYREISYLKSTGPEDPKYNFVETINGIEIMAHQIISIKRLKE